MKKKLLLLTLSLLVVSISYADGDNEGWRGAYNVYNAIREAANKAALDAYNAVPIIKKVNDDYTAACHALDEKRRAVREAYEAAKKTEAYEAAEKPAKVALDAARLKAARIYKEADNAAWLKYYGFIPGTSSGVYR